MVKWMAGWVWWFTWRAVATLVCLWTIQNAIHFEGYRVEFSTLLVAGVCAIIGIRVWMPSYKESSRDNDDR